VGQDDSCGICGKYYQSCRHYVKEHLPYSAGVAFCGRKKVLVLGDDWFDRDIAEEDLCKDCVRLDPLAAAKYGEDDGLVMVVD